MSRYPHQGAREPAPRDAGDDVIVQLRVRRANLPALEAGHVLGIDSLTERAIELRLVKEPDGVYAIEVVTNPLAKASTPDAVSAEVVPDE